VIDDLAATFSATPQRTTHLANQGETHETDLGGSCDRARGCRRSSLLQSSRHAKSRPTTTTPTLPTTTTTSAPFNQVAPITNAAVSTSATSQHWAGYTFDSTGVTGVRAEWTEPDVKGQPSDQEYVWIGIGGWNESASTSNLIQIGTYAYFPPDGGPMNEGIWYEEVPGGGSQWPRFC
jgi:hypothetical protein